MGGKSSREASGSNSREASGSNSRQNSYQERHYSREPAPNYPPQSPSSHSNYNQYSANNYSAPVQQTYPQNYQNHTNQTGKRLDRKYSQKYTQIADNYRSLDQVTEALAQAGLESSNLIVGIDFTKSNEWTGKHSFHNRSLHHIGDAQNPYEQAISIIGRTLSVFDEDNLIPCFGFGDASTHDQDVFSFYPDERPCNGFSEALTRYREIVPQLRLAGPTSFAPIIEMAMTIVEQSSGQYHVLLIIADGQVTRSVDLELGQLSSQEQKTVDAIVKASDVPLSIILVGVGDGPWDMMKEFDDNIPARAFDNFQFVNFTEIMSKTMPQARKETEFALSALMEIPLQYKATIELGVLGHVTSKNTERVPLPPPFGSYSNTSIGFRPYGSACFAQQSTSTSEHKPPRSVSLPSATSYAGSNNDQQVCPICLTNPKNMAFGCGHQTCYECGPGLQLCPICRSEIVTRIRLY